MTLRSSTTLQIMVMKNISGCKVAISACNERRYESYPDVIPKDKSDDPHSASFNGGGVRNEHFIVWMRAAALPRFRKLYGRFTKDIPAGSELEFSITNSRWSSDNG